MKVSEIKYVRPNVQEVAAKLKGYVQDVIDAKSAEEQVEIDKKVSKLTDDVSTMYNVAYIRFSQDTRDKFYVGENEYFDQQMPSLIAVATDLKKAYLNSKFADEFFKHFPPIFRKNLEIQARAMDDKIIDDMVEESKVTTEYTQLMSSITVDFNGEKLPLSGLSKYNSNADRALRKAAYMAYGGQMAKHAEQIDSIYDRQVKIRDTMAKKMGMTNYVELGYLSMTRNCYDKTDIARFRENVKKYIVPLCVELKQKVGKQLNIDKMYLYDIGVDTATEPKPIGTPEQLMDKAGVMYDALGEETSRLFKKMRDAESFDILSREGKWGGGYCTTIENYKLPFILSNFNGSYDDISTLTHEFGHALAAYKAFDLKDTNCTEGGMETCEVHSMSMEFFAYKFMESFFGDMTPTYKFSHLASAITFIPYGTIVDYFQTLCYENPSMTPKERNMVWDRIEKEFMPYMTTEGIPYFEEGRRWQVKAHIFERPFYYIDYCLAQFTAFQFLALSLEDYDKAFEKYMKFLNQAGTKPFTQLLESVGLKSPFDESSFVEVVQAVKKLLNV